MKKPTLTLLSDALQTLLLTLTATGGTALVLRLCVKPDQTLLIIPCLFAALAMAACTLLHLFLPRFSALPPLVGALIGCFIFGLSAVLRGLFGFVNYIIGCWNLAYEAAVPLLSANATFNDLQGFLIVLLLLCTCVPWYIAQRRTLWLALLLSGCWIALPMILRLFPSLGCALLLSFMLGVWLFQRAPGSPMLRTGWFLFALAALTGLGLIFRTPAPVAAVADLRRSVTEGIHHLRYGTTTLPGGDLYKADTMLGSADEETPTLEVTGASENSLYLRGYVGGRYVDGVWKPLSGSDYGGDNTGMLNWMEQRGLVPQTQYSAYVSADKSAYTPSSVTVENVGTDRSWLYLPYSAIASNSWSDDMEQDGTVKGTGVLGTRFYFFTDTSSALPGELLQQKEWLTAPTTAAEKSYIQAEGVYRSFVYDHYLTVDPSLSALIQSTFWPDDERPTNLYTAVQQIRAVLEDVAAYSDDPSAVPEREDPIRWFLNGGEGNSALYAAAAVEAFRAAGFPARYAEGYLLPGDRAAGDSTITLTSRDSHAWAEVYLDGMGWVPVDTAPGFYLETYKLQQMVEHPIPIHQSSADSNSDSASQGDTFAESTSSDVTVEWSDPQISALGALVLLLILCVIGIAYLAIRRWLMLWINGKALNQKQQRKRQAALCRLIEQTLAVLGITCCPGWHNEATDQQLCGLLPEFHPGEYRQAADVMERFAYRTAPLTPAEERVLTVFLNRIWTYRRDLPLRMRFRLRYHFYPRRSPEKSR